MSEFIMFQLTPLWFQQTRHKASLLSCHVRPAWLGYSMPAPFILSPWMYECLHVLILQQYNLQLNFAICISNYVLNWFVKFGIQPAEHKWVHIREREEWAHEYVCRHNGIMWLLWLLTTVLNKWLADLDIHANIWIHIEPCVLCTSQSTPFPSPFSTELTLFALILINVLAVKRDALGFEWKWL